MKKKKLSDLSKVSNPSPLHELLATLAGNPVRLGLNELFEYFKLGAPPLFTDIKSYDQNGGVLTINLPKTIPAGTTIHLSVDVVAIVKTTRMNFALASASSVFSTNLIPHTGDKRYYLHTVLEQDMSILHLYPQDYFLTRPNPGAGHMIFSNITII